MPTDMKWLNRYQPPMLQNATTLLYINAVFGLLFFAGAGHPLLLVSGLFRLAGGPAGWAIANEKKWGYALAIGAAVVPATVTVLGLVGIFRYAAPFNLAVNLLIQGVLVVLVLHPSSRNYAKTYFK